MFGKSFENSTASTSVDIYRLTSAWSETTSTWNDSSTGTPWTNPGGDAVGTTGQQLTNPYTTWTVNGRAPATWFDFDVTYLVSQMVHGSVVNNVSLMTGAAGNQLSWITREGHGAAELGGLAADAPVLKVTFTPAPEPIGFLALGLSLAGLVLKRARH